MFKSNCSNRCDSESSSEDETLSSVNEDNYEWTTKRVKAFINAVIQCKPAGVHKMTSLFLIREMMNEELQEDISTHVILKKINSCWDTEAADEIESKKLLIKQANFNDTIIKIPYELMKEEIEKFNQNYSI